MKRLQWNLRTGLAGGYFLASDNCPYFIGVFTTLRGVRCQIMDQYFTPISKEIKFNSAKSKILSMMKNDGNYYMECER